MKPSNVFGAALVVALILSGVVGYYIFQKASQRPPLPVLGQVKPFTLTDQQGVAFDSQQLYRNVWIASVFSTPCEKDCYKMMSNMASLSRTFDQVPAVHLISVSLNPEKDSPRVLSEYSNRLSTGKSNWSFLTGNKKQIEDLQQNQLKLELAESNPAYSPTIALVDRSGYVRKYYDGARMEDVNQLFLDASLLIKDRF